MSVCSRSYVVRLRHLLSNDDSVDVTLDFNCHCLSNFLLVNLSESFSVGQNSKKVAFGAEQN